MKNAALRSRPLSERIQTIEADVLVAGGGVAGCLAILAATEAGASVVVCDKSGRLERAGSVAGGVDHFLALLEEGPEWDTPDYLVKRLPAFAEGVIDVDVAERLIRGLKPMVRLLEGLGVDFHDPENPDIQYYRHRSFGLPGKYYINFDGRNFKHVIGHAARRTRARVFERTMVTDLIMEDGRPKGGIAFNIRTGEVYVILARAVVLATGDANRIGTNASGHPFDSWHSPYNAGEGRAMALRAGARLANMEFTDSTVSVKGYSSQGLNAFAGGGAYFRNALGERFMFKYHPSGERGRRTDIITGVVTETIEGRGPIYCDCTHLPQDESLRLVNTLGLDRPALPAFFEQKNIDLTKEPFEISVTEIASVRGGESLRGGGVHIDTEASSTTPGVYAAGDCSTASAGVAGASVMGYLAGGSAARYALSQPEHRPLSAKELEQLREALYQPLQLQEGVTSRAFEDRVRSIVTDYVGMRRTEDVMREGLRQLVEMRSQETEMVADDYHGVMRVNEARSIRFMAEAMAVSAIERRESRSAGAHVRVDYPDMNNETGVCIVTVEEVQGELKATSRPTNLSLTKYPDAPGI